MISQLLIKFASYLYYLFQFHFFHSYVSYPRKNNLNVAVPFVIMFKLLAVYQFILHPFMNHHYILLQNFDSCVYWQPGIMTDDIDKAVHQMIIDNGAYPSPLGYGGFPKSVCTSVNECICHGIPDSRVLEVFSMNS